jgi:hypothetical protein
MAPSRAGVRHADDDFPRPSSPRIQDVARHAGVAIGTVSNVLNNPHLVTEQTRLKVEAAIAELGFVRNSAARALAARRTDTGARSDARCSSPSQWMGQWMGRYVRQICLPLG